MTRRFVRPLTGTVVACVALTACGVSGPGDGPAAGAAMPSSAASRGFEVWIADQSDTRESYGGQLLIYEGADLIPVTGYAAGNPPKTPAPQVVFSKAGAADSHGVAAAGGDRYLWVMERHNDVAEIIDLARGERVHTVDLNGPLTDRGGACYVARATSHVPCTSPVAGTPHVRTSGT